MLLPEGDVSSCLIYIEKRTLDIRTTNSFRKDKTITSEFMLLLLVTVAENFSTAKTVFLGLCVISTNSLFVHSNNLIMDIMSKLSQLLQTHICKFFCQLF